MLYELGIVPRAHPQSCSVIGFLGSLESNHHIDLVNIAKATEKRDGKGDDDGGGISVPSCPRTGMKRLLLYLLQVPEEVRPACVSPSLGLKFTNKSKAQAASSGVL